jgi:diguanylate cyclase (GGDEF)-like protein
VSKRLKKEVREVDTVARMGGDEFTLILPELHGRKDAEQVAERIRGAIARPYSLGDKVLEVSASLGVSLYPLDGRDVRTLMKRADMAMYRAKNDGRNLWRFWEENTETPRK